ncbi:DNA-binding transcriptional regulator, IclR family [Mesobacillus persicus]|uniref:DNA-binding transcriptional regulator, IclR family n=1 Tax=Mesobacillus persicus TaxID=930146 RepID=A0A1H8DAD2_9BACI|nr:IclR family transcriptional regulator [Mesobacillus persicus]SEN04085.1 DNA-binding transcriptional regulator, IclR family [Mesobacillus persicus]
MEAKKQIHKLSTVDNAISLLSLFLKYDSIGLMDIERELGISKTAAFRLAVTLTDRGFLVKNSKTKQYHPGPILFQLSRKFQVNDIISVSQPYIQELASLTNESVYLSIRSGNKFLFLTGIDSVYPAKVTSPFGDEIDLYFGAAGKLHMAYMSSADIDTYFKRVVLEQFTPATHTEPIQLRAELKKIRENGYSTSLGERDPDSAGIAAPIWGLGEEPTGALGIYLPMSRLNDQKLPELIALAKGYAEKISAEIILEKE